MLLDERGAAYFALGMSKAGRPCAVVTTSGTAAANLHPAILEADKAGVPLLAITADRPLELVDVGANQAVTQPRLFGGAVRWSITLPVPETQPRVVAHARQAACRAAAIALQQRGPVHLNVPLREGVLDPPGSTIGDLPSTGPPSTSVAPAPRVPDPSWMDALEGPRGLVVACSGADASAVQAARHLGVPIVCDGLAAFPGALPHADAFLASDALRGRLRPDWILHLGAAPTGKSLPAYFARHADRPRLKVHGHGNLWDDSASATHLVPCDPRQACEQLLFAAPRGGDLGWRALWEQASKAACDATRQATTPDWEAAIPNTLLQAAGGGLLWVGSSLPVRDLDRFGHAMAARVLANRGASGIDGVLASAAGAAAAHPAKRCIAYVGDLTFLHDIGSLAAVKRYAPHLSVVVVNNGGGGIFAHLDVARSPHFGELFLTPQDVDIGKACAAYGLRHQRIAGVEGLAAALQEPGVVVEVTLDLEVCVRRRKEHLAAVAAAVETIGAT